MRNTGGVFLGMLVLRRFLPRLELERHLDVAVRSRGHRAVVPVNPRNVGAGRRHTPGWQQRESPLWDPRGAQEPLWRGQGTVGAGKVAKLVVCNAPKPSGCRSTDRGSLRPRSAGRRLINTWALIIKWLIVPAGPIEAAIYGAAGARPIPTAQGKHWAGGEETATWVRTEPAPIGS